MCLEINKPDSGSSVPMGRCGLSQIGTKENDTREGTVPNVIDLTGGPFACHRLALICLG